MAIKVWLLPPMNLKSEWSHSRSVVFLNNLIIFMATQYFRFCPWPKKNKILQSVTNALEIILVLEFIRIITSLEKWALLSPHQLTRNNSPGKNASYDAPVIKWEGQERKWHGSIKMAAAFVFFIRPSRSSQAKVPLKQRWLSSCIQEVCTWALFLHLSLTALGDVWCAGHFLYAHFKQSRGQILV